MTCKIILLKTGVVTACNLMTDKMTGRSRSFAFVEFATPEDAQKAIEQFHEQEFQGRKIAINVVRSREDCPPRSDRGGFGGGERRERY